jgi:hypothetical protein
MVSVFGGIGLTWDALADPNPYRLGVMLVYAIGVVGGTVWLASRG